AALFGPALEGFDPAAPRIAAQGAVGAWRALDDLARGAAAPDAARGELPAKLMLTSGSTGAPKAVVMTHANLAVNAAQIAACFDDPEPPVTVNAAPWSHSLGANALLHMVTHRGGTLYVDPGQPTPARFAATLQALSEVGSTYHNMVPAGWALLADALEADPALARTFFARLRVMQYGGAGLPQSVLDRVQAAGVRACGERVTFAAGYGITETAPTATNVHWFNRRAGLLGLPVPGTEVRLAPVGDRLELRLKGPQIAPGYRTADGSLRPLDLDEDGWLRTGDAVRLADAGDDPRRGGLVFDGRLVENFKLATGAFVGAGPLRLAVLSALGGLASDAVVCGEGQAGVGLLLFANAGACAAFSGAAADGPHACEALATQVRARLAAFNAEARGAGGRIARALVLAGGPDAASGEVTDKGYLNQALARSRRAADIARLFASAPDPLVVVL
ncbi:MAG: AMP-binding protein, partial [Caulobacteraceae bacterium]|nr:AMP-binding protein [Caulobacter sp.]